MANNFINVRSYVGGVATCFPCFAYAHGPDFSLSFIFIIVILQQIPLLHIITWRIFLFTYIYLIFVPINLVFLIVYHDVSIGSLILFSGLPIVMYLFLYFLKIRSTKRQIEPIRTHKV